MLTTFILIVLVLVTIMHAGCAALDRLFAPRH